MNLLTLDQVPWTAYFSIAIELLYYPKRIHQFSRKE